MKMFLAAAVAILITSCVPNTPDARIQRHPQKFSSLPSRHQELVRQGQITRGMSFDAVYLAWGQPHATYQGSRKSRSLDRWDYVGSRPVPVQSFYGSFGYGAWGPWGPWGACGPYDTFGFGTDFAYIPYRIASVWFEDGKVDAWERAR